MRLNLLVYVAELGALLAVSTAVSNAARRALRRWTR